MWCRASGSRATPPRSSRCCAATRARGSPATSTRSTAATRRRSDRVTLLRVDDAPKLPAGDVEGARAAWRIVCHAWAETTERAASLPEALLHERVDGEW